MGRTAHANNIYIAEDGISLTYEVFPVPWFGVCPLQDFVYPIMVKATKCEFTLLLGEAAELSSLELWVRGSARLVSCNGGRLQGHWEL